LTEAREVLSRALDEDLVTRVAQVGDAIVETLRSGGSLFFFGNGGSAADAGHLAAEFVGRCTRDRPALRAVSLADNVATLTAVANDYGFESVFSRGIEGLGRTGDVAIGMTTSGRSGNVLRGLAAAEARGLMTVVMCGADPGPSAGVADHVLAVPSRRVGRIQEMHLLWGQTWAEHAEVELFGDLENRDQ
jgi:D-sedoheptulose 7-phosphate isomerase